MCSPSGTRTWGGLCALSSSEAYSDNYAGYVGEKDKTSVFCYIPLKLAITLDGRILEGKGVSPDIQVAMDMEKWMKGAGPDSQLDRALQFIRNGR